jgi:hypothetical protein
MISSKLIFWNTHEITEFGLNVKPRINANFSVGNSHVNLCRSKNFCSGFFRENTLKSAERVKTSGAWLNDEGAWLNDEGAWLINVGVKAGIREEVGVPVTKNRVPESHKSDR